MLRFYVNKSIPVIEQQCFSLAPDMVKAQVPCTLINFIVMAMKPLSASVNT
ncbi:hypothetical protein DPMN_181751 [Dreissena polymorpha]|uniref:Uncharacterized protein n=1 Tax=Dreissena polymorpha TaxID=45954 RepID=A0A9D4I1Y4_DREPO|nr:hypothetical protein DPMN_181751 [Dreissena polymorpha]